MAKIASKWRREKSEIMLDLQTHHSIILMLRSMDIYYSFPHLMDEEGNWGTVKLSDLLEVDKTYIS